MGKSMVKIAYLDNLCTKQLPKFCKWFYFFIYLCRKVEILKINLEILIIYSVAESTVICQDSHKGVITKFGGSDYTGHLKKFAPVKSHCPAPYCHKF